MYETILPLLNELADLEKQIRKKLRGNTVLLLAYFLTDKELEKYVCEFVGDYDGFLAHVDEVIGERPCPCSD